MCECHRNRYPACPLTHALHAQVKGHLERQGKPVDGITVSGFWDREIYAGYPDGTRKLLWKANPPHLPGSL